VCKVWILSGKLVERLDLDCYIFAGGFVFFLEKALPFPVVRDVCLVEFKFPRKVLLETQTFHCGPISLMFS
jgi:hypothetical protein